MALSEHAKIYLKNKYGTTNTKRVTTSVDPLADWNKRWEELKNGSSVPAVQGGPVTISPDLQIQQQAEADFDAALEAQRARELYDATGGMLMRVDGRGQKTATAPYTGSWGAEQEAELKQMRNQLRYPQVSADEVAKAALDLYAETGGGISQVGITNDQLRTLAANESVEEDILAAIDQQRAKRAALGLSPYASAAEGTDREKKTQNLQQALQAEEDLLTAYQEQLAKRDATSPYATSGFMPVDPTEQTLARYLGESALSGLAGSLEGTRNFFVDLAAEEARNDRFGMLSERDAIALAAETGGAISPELEFTPNSEAKRRATAAQVIGYRDNSKSQALQENLASYNANPQSAVGIAGNVAAGVGGMLPAIGANLLVPGSGSAVMFSSAAGQAASEALKAGATYDEAFTYGVVSGATEIATEKILGGIPGLGKGWFDKKVAATAARMSTSPLGRYLVKMGAEALGEGFEEWLSEAIGQYTVRIYDEDERNRSVMDVATEGRDDRLYAALIGALTSLAMQAPTVNANNVSAYNTEAAKAGAEAELRENLPFMRTMIDMAGTAEDINNRTTDALNASVEKSTRYADEDPYYGTQLFDISEQMRSALGANNYERHLPTNYASNKLLTDAASINKLVNSNKLQAIEIWRELRELVNSYRGQLNDEQTQIVKAERAFANALQGQPVDTIMRNADGKPGAVIINSRAYPNSTQQTEIATTTPAQTAQTEAQQTTDMLSAEMPQTVVQQPTQQQIEDELVSMVTGEPVPSERIVKVDGVDVERADVDFTPTDAVKALKNFGRNFNRNVVVVKSLPNGADGAMQNGVIYLSETAQNPMFTVFKHELTHTLRGAKVFDSFAQFAEQQMQQRMGAKYDGFVIDLQDRYAAAGKPLDGAKLSEEIASNYVEKYLFNDQEAVNELTRQYRSTAYRIWSKLRDAVRQLNKNTRLSPEEMAIKKAEQMFAKALAQTKNPATEDGAKYDIRNTKHYTWKSQIDALLNNSKSNVKVKRSDSLYLGKLSDVVPIDGIDSDSISVPIRVISKAMDKRDDNHSLNKATVRKLDGGVRYAPAVIYNPNYKTTDGKTSSSVVFVTSLVHNDKPVIVSCVINVDDHGETVNEATSIHARSNFNSYIGSLPKESKIYVRNEKEFRNLVGAEDGVQFATLATNAELIDASKTYPGDFVNPSSDYSLPDTQQRPNNENIASNNENIASNNGIDLQAALDQQYGAYSNAKYAVANKAKQVFDIAEATDDDDPRNLSGVKEMLNDVSENREGIVNRPENLDDVEMAQMLKGKVRGFRGYNLTPDRVVKQVSGGVTMVENWLRKNVLDPLYTAKGEYSKQVLARRNDLYDKVVNKLGITKGSRESAAIMWYGEGKRITGVRGDGVAETEEYTLDDLKRDFPTNWNKIVEAEKYFRAQYDQYVDRINAEREKIYPNVDNDAERALRMARGRVAGAFADLETAQENARRNPQNEDLQDEVLARQEVVELRQQQLRKLEKEVDSGDYFRRKRLLKRKDYFHHFSEMQGTFAQIKDIMSSATDIDSRLAGISDFTQPKTKWQGIFQKQGRNAYVEDAVAGFLKYIDQAEFAVNIDPVIAQNRGFIKMLAENTSETKNANGFIEWMMDWTNDLAGKTNPFDRAMQKAFSRSGMKVLDKINGVIKGSKIAGNISSAVAQFFNVQNAFLYVTNPASWTEGARNYGAALKSGSDAQRLMSQSAFLRERYLDNSLLQFDPLTLKNSPERFASAMMEFGDKEMAKLIWFTAHADGQRKRVADPVKYADEITRKSVGGRGIGEQPILQKSQITKLLAPFQLEVSNSWYALQETIKDKNAAGILGFLVSGWIMNAAAEAIRGSSVSMDLLGAVIDEIRNWIDEDDEEEKTTAGQKAAGLATRLAGETLSNMPYGSLIGTMITSGDDDLAEDLFGESDPTRFGVGNVGISALVDPALELVTAAKEGTSPDWGELVENTALNFVPYGNQINKTLDAAQATWDWTTPFDDRPAGSYTDSGNLRFAVDKSNPVSVGQGLLFGQYATKEGREYIDSGAMPNASKTQRAQAMYEAGIALDEALAFINSTSGIKAADAPGALYDEFGDDLTADQYADLWNAYKMKSWTSKINPFEIAADAKVSLDDFLDVYEEYNSGKENQTHLYDVLASSGLTVQQQEDIWEAYMEAKGWKKTYDEIRSEAYK